MPRTARHTDYERQPRQYNADERKVKMWIKRNHGILTRVAAELGLSVQYVSRVAYNRSDPSKGLRIERKLIQLGCPLIQRSKIKL